MNPSIEQRSIQVTVNETPMTLAVDPRSSLLEVLREQGILSVKEGCGVGECGACTVLVDEMPVDACIYLAVWTDGRSIRTCEGEEKDGKLSAVQQAFVDEGAVQCGICTPGFIMAATSFVESRKGKACSRKQIRRGLAGNLCRCTGYDTIVDAVEKCLDDDGTEQ